MRRLLCCSIPRWALTAAAVAAIAIAVAAWQLGLDNNPAMGTRRILLLLSGIGTLLILHHRRITWDHSLTRLQLTRLPRVDALPRDGRTHTPSSSRRLWPVLFAILPSVFASYLWLVTAGEWAKPPPETTFYCDMLAEAFASGQTCLKQSPDPRLAELANPYDPSQRSGIPRCRSGMDSSCILWDASYHEGRYYLYWGPAPAAVLTPLKLAGLGRLGDLPLTLIGAGVLFSLATYCLIHLWHRYLSHLPQWLLIPALLYAGLAYPLPWALDTPQIYEAAILLGVALLMAGLAVALPFLISGEPKVGRFALVGLLWRLSFGTRAVLGLPIAVLALAIAWRVFRLQPTGSRARHPWKPLAALALPLASAIVHIGLYNVVRFSHPLEFGWQYALGAPVGQSAGTGAAFDVGNIPVNIYNYFLAPISLLGGFPFLQPMLAAAEFGPIQVPHPTLFYGEYVSGLLISSPFLIFAVYIAWWLICETAPCAKGEAEEAPALPDRAGLRVIAWALLSAAVGALLPILTLYAVTARYMLDVVPMAVILAALGAWTAYRDAQPTPLIRSAVGFIIVASAVASGVVSILRALNNLSR